MASSKPYPYLRHESDGIGGRLDSAALWGVGKAFQGGKWLAGKAVDIGVPAAKFAGRAGVSATAGIGSATLATARNVGEMAWSSLNSSNPIANPVGTAARALTSMAGKMVEYKPAETVWNTTQKKLVDKPGSFKLTKFGTGVVLGGSMLSSAINAFDKFKERSLGRIDTQVTNSTPDYRPQEYSTSNNLIDPAGATGDLVFALYKNRKGGSML